MYLRISSRNNKVQGVSKSAVQCRLVSNRCVASATAHCMAVQPINDQGPPTLLWAGSQK